MELLPMSREYAHWGIKGLPVPPPPAEVHIAGAWHDLEYWDGDGGNDPTFPEIVTKLGLKPEDIAAGTARVARLLVAGPDANPGDAVVLAPGSNVASVRVLSNPEEPARAGSSIRVPLSTA